MPRAAGRAAIGVGWVAHPRTRTDGRREFDIMSDKTILQHIAELVEEEHSLRGDAARPDANAARLKHLAEQLDQCWDLLRQRRARREFGEDPQAARARDVKTVEGYEG
jgi:hypothetical protein